MAKYMNEARTQELINEIKSRFAKKATTLAGYGITDAYTKVQTEEAIAAAVASVYKAKGSVTFENLPSLSSVEEGWVYNVTDDFTTTSDFIEGAGVHVGAYTEIVAVNVSSTSTPEYKWSILGPMFDPSTTQEKFQYDTAAAIQALATADNLGKVYQYTGATSGSWVNGNFYRVVSSGDPVTYSIAEVDNVISQAELTAMWLDAGILRTTVDGSDVTEFTINWDTGTHGPGTEASLAITEASGPVTIADVQNIEDAGDGTYQGDIGGSISFSGLPSASATFNAPLTLTLRNMAAAGACDQDFTLNVAASGEHAAASKTFTVHLVMD